MAGRRDGEMRLTHDPGQCDDARLAFIGRIRSPWSRGNCPRNLRAARETGRPARIELAPGYGVALSGLAVGEAVVLSYWVDQGMRDLALQHPAHLEAPRGTFALRSPVRPNPIGLGVVLITGLDAAAGIVGIDAIDAFDDTPVLDIKPWIAAVDTPPGS